MDTMFFLRIEKRSTLYSISQFLPVAWLPQHSIEIFCGSWHNCFEETTSIVRFSAPVFLSKV